MRKNQWKTTRGHADGGVEVIGGEGFEYALQITLPEWRILRIAARSVLLALFVFTFSRIKKTSVLQSGNVGAGSDFVASAAGDQYIDDLFFLPMIFRDLRGEGFFQPGTGKAVFLADDDHRRFSHFLKRNKLDPVTAKRRSSIPDDTVDFVFSANGTTASVVHFVNRVLKIGGMVAVRLSSHPSASLPFPPNYKPVYVRRLGSTIVAMRRADADDAIPPTISIGRKLSIVPESKQEALSGLEDVLLEPPRASSGNLRLFLKRTRYLPDITGDTLAGYKRQLFVDVVPPEHYKRKAQGWFEKHYPTRHRRFEIIRLEEREDAREAEKLSWWLRRNVREEDYVVMKAEAEVAEALVRSGAVGLVDELFLECGNLWGNGCRRGRKAYWECLALYGRLRDEGVAVHQWRG